MDIAKLVDDLGSIRAAQAELVRKEQVIKKKLVKLGAGAYEGDVFRATVSIVARDLLDMDAVRAKLTAQFITANTRTVTSPRVDVHAKVDGKQKLAA